MYGLEHLDHPGGRAPVEVVDVQHDPVDPAAEAVARNRVEQLHEGLEVLPNEADEPEPVAAAIEHWMPTGLVAHIQLNDSNRRGPGEGKDAFAPVLAALKRTGYSGWLAMEPFEYIPDGPTCAARSIGYVAGILEAIA